MYLPLRMVFSNRRQNEASTAADFHKASRLWRILVERPEDQLIAGLEPEARCFRGCKLAKALGIKSNSWRCYGLSLHAFRPYVVFCSAAKSISHRLCGSSAVRMVSGFGAGAGKNLRAHSPAPLRNASSTTAFMLYCRTTASARMVSVSNITAQAHP